MSSKENNLKLLFISGFSTAMSQTQNEKPGPENFQSAGCFSEEVRFGDARPGGANRQLGVRTWVRLASAIHSLKKNLHLVLTMH